MVRYTEFARIACVYLVLGSPGQSLFHVCGGMCKHTTYYNIIEKCKSSLLCVCVHVCVCVCVHMSRYMCLCAHTVCNDTHDLKGVLVQGKEKTKHLLIDQFANCTNTLCTFSVCTKAAAVLLTVFP